MPTKKTVSKHKKVANKTAPHNRAVPTSWVDKIRIFIKNRPPLSWFQRAVVAVLIIGLVATAGMYGVARWYIAKYDDQPIEFGATFIPSYARYLGVDPQSTMEAMVDDLGLERLRLVSYWNVGEPEQGKYNFDELDWQFKMAEEKGVKVTLAIGLRQPRWPECHMPKWAEQLPKEQWAPLLKDYMREVILRYKDSPVLESYQLENEFFIKVFGICPDHSRDRLIDEYNFVKSTDSSRPLIVSMSNNAIGTPINEPTPDQWSISVYKRVWDKDMTKRYLEYPIPAWYYAFRAGFTELTRGRTSFIHELQTESWTPGTLGARDTPLQEQYKSLNAKRLHHRMEYGRATGMKPIYLWGVEWWYFLKEVKGDPSVWDAGREEIIKTEAQNTAKGI